METGFQRWIVNLAAFCLFVLLAATGLIAWILPHAGGPAGAIYGLRQLLRAVHQTGALLFGIVIIVHLWLHWGYIRENLKKHGMIKR